jgi:hypothetical protein
VHGWRDPFDLLQVEDPGGDILASVIAQEGVVAESSGAAIDIADSNEFIVEGVRGSGSEFMLGRAAAEDLSEGTTSAVLSVCSQVRKILGCGFKIEWAFDGEVVWIVQLQRLTAASAGFVIVPGNASSFREFDVARGIDALRAVIQEAARSGEGVLLKGAVGITSHFGDLLRRSNVPSRVVP